MVKDIPVDSESEAAVEWGFDLGFEEGEEMPADVEGLSEAQYTIFKMAQILKGTFDAAESKQTIQQVMGDKGSGIVVPD